jgi:hypothetical protein
MMAIIFEKIDCSDTKTANLSPVEFVRADRALKNEYHSGDLAIASRRQQSTAQSRQAVGSGPSVSK